MSDAKAAKDALVASLFELSKAAQDAANATLEFYKTSSTDATVPVSTLNNLASTIKSLIPSVENGTQPPVVVKVEKKKKPERDPNAPKKPLTMYFAYSFHIRDALREDRKRKNLPALSAIEMNEYVKDRWGKLTDEEKQFWKDKYQRELVVYNKEKEAYKAKLEGKPAPSPSFETSVTIPSNIDLNLDYISDLPTQPTKLTNLDDSEDDSDDEVLKKEKKEKKRKNREEKEKKKKKKLLQQQHQSS